MDKSIRYVRSCCTKSQRRYRDRYQSGGISGHSLEKDSQSPSVASADDTSTRKHTESELSNMTVVQLRQLASDNGYALSATNKAGIIKEILSQQG
mgnify:FL=1